MVIHLDKKDDRLRKYTVYFLNDPDDENPLIIKSDEMGVGPTFVQFMDENNVVHWVLLHGIQRITAEILEESNAAKQTI